MKHCNLYPKKETPVYFVNYTGVEYSTIITRSTSIKQFDLLRDARVFLAAKEVVGGYIIRCVKKGAKILEFKNFDPSPTEYRHIEAILKSWNG